MLVGIGIHELEVGNRQLALANLILIALWMAIAAGIAHRHRRLTLAPARRPAVRGSRSARAFTRLDEQV